MANIRPEEFLGGGDFKVMAPDEFLEGGDFRLEGEPEKKPGFFSKVKGDLKKRFDRAFSATEAFRLGKQTFGEAALQTTGKIAGGIGDIIGRGIEAVAPEFVKKGVKKVGLEILETPIGKEGLKALQGGMELYEGWKAKNPRAAANLEAVVNVASILPIGKGGQVVAKGAKAGLPVVKEAAGAATTRIATSFAKRELSKIDTFIDSSLIKGIRPAVKGTAPQFKAFQGKAREAVFTILENKNNLKFADEAGDFVTKLPENLREFSESVDQTKKFIFKQYDSLAQSAGEAGAKVKLVPIVKELRTVTKNKVLRDQAPEVVSYAERRAKALFNRKQYSTSEAQEAVEILNRNLEAFYKNPTYDNATKVTIDAMIANNLRKGLDEAVSGITGKQYQVLKNKYGALKTVEKDVARRAIVDARKNIKGLIDYSDILSGGQVVSGILSLNPALVASGATQKIIASVFKRINDPNRIIKNMFQKVDKVVERAKARGISRGATKQ